MNMAGLGGWRGLSRALKCFGVRGFLRRVRQDHKVAPCMAHNLARARKSESIRARIWYPGGYPGIPEDTRIREPIVVKESTYRPLYCVKERKILFLGSRTTFDTRKAWGKL